MPQKGLMRMRDEAQQSPAKPSYAINAMLSWGASKPVGNGPPLPAKTGLRQSGWRAGHFPRRRRYGGQ